MYFNLLFYFLLFSDQKLNQLEDTAKAAKKGKWADDASVSANDNFNFFFSLFF